MPIRRAQCDDSFSIVSFLAKVFSEEIVRVNCGDLSSGINSGNYVSFIFELNKKIMAHFGISLFDNIALFNMMAVDEEYRKQGISKDLLSRAIDYCETRGDITHIFAYCVLDHSYSERIHDKTFLPVGIMPYLKRPVSESRKNSSFDGNLVLCKPLQERRVNSFIGSDQKNTEEILRLCNSLGVEVLLGESNEVSSEPVGVLYEEVNLSDQKSCKKLPFLSEADFELLGMIPTQRSGFSNFGFLRKGNYGELSQELSIPDRTKFVRGVIERLKND